MQGCWVNIGKDRLILRVPQRSDETKVHHDELRSGFLFQREIGIVQERSLGHYCGVIYVLIVRRTDCSLISDDCCLKYNSGRTTLFGTVAYGIATPGLLSLRPTLSTPALGCPLPLVPLRSPIGELACLGKQR